MWLLVTSRRLVQPYVPGTFDEFEHHNLNTCLIILVALGMILDLVAQRRAR